MSENLLPPRLEAFIESVSTANSLDDIFSALSRRITELGFEYFSYWMTWSPDPTAQRVCITNYNEEWSRYYAQNGYAADDLLGRMGATCTTPFLWEPIMSQANLTDRQRLIFAEGADAGMRSGGTVPLHGPMNALAIFSVSNSTGADGFAQLFKAKRHEIQLIAAYAHERIIQLRILSPDNSDQTEKLTIKETEVLTWASRGKTVFEIAAILGIQETTVKRHLENTRQKLNASNTSHAIAKAIMTKQVMPWPQGQAYTVNRTKVLS